MIRKAAGWAIFATFVGTIAEIEAAGPFRPVAWWRIPLTGGGLIATAGALAWADKQIGAGHAEDR